MMIKSCNHEWGVCNVTRYAAECVKEGCVAKGMINHLTMISHVLRARAVMMWRGTTRTC